MRKVSEKCRRALSAILAAAMVLTSAPGTTMTAMAAEQTDAMETVVDSEEITVDDAASPDGEEKAALDGEEGTDEGGTGSETTQLETPQFTMNPVDGKVANRGEASFSLTVPENSQVYYVIGDADQGEDAVAEPGASSNEYTSGTTVQVPAPDQYTEATVVVKAIAIPNGSDASASYTASEVATTTFTFEAYERVTLGMPKINLDKTEATNREKDVTFTITDLPTVDGAVVKYTVDGTDPISSSTALEYVSDVRIFIDAPEKDTEERVTIKAAAVATDTEKYNNSEVAEATVTFAEKVETEAPAAPTITLKSGENTLENGAKVEFGTKVSMEIAAAEGTTIYYTKDGSDPTDKSEQYKEVVTLSSAKEEGETVTVKAIAVADDKISDVTTATVRFDGEKFTLTVESENFGAFTVELSEKAVGQDKYEKLSIADDHKVQITKGAEVSGVVKANGNYSFVSVVLAGTDWLKVAPNKAVVSVGYVNVSKNQTLTVVTKAACDVKVVNEKDIEINKTAEGDDAGKYVVNPGTYTITATVKGSETAVAVDAAAILVGGKANKGASQPKADNNAVTLTVGSDLYGKDFEVQLKSKNEVVETVNFKAVPVLTKAIVAGVNNKGALTQNILSYQGYDMALTPNTLTGEELQAQLGVYSTDSELVEASFGPRGYGRTLYLQTTKTATKNPVKVFLYNKLLCEESGQEVTVEEIEKAAVATINVNVALPAWTKNPLAVKCVDSTDTELKVSVTAPAGLNYDTEGYYYIFDVKDPSTVSGNIPAVSKYFVEDATAGTKTYTLKVMDADTGKGAAKSFEVKAYLVWATGENKPADLNDENIVAKTAEAKSPLKCSTKAPYYADKISLKKGTTTIYSGQQGVQIATINYGKNTTYLTAKADLVGVTDQDIIDGIDLKVEDGKVYATVGKETTPGKYTVKVTAEADADMKAAEATLPITVVAGISEITAVGSTDKIYLDTSKGGKASVTVAYGSYNTENKPKSAKFIYTLGKVVEGEFVADAAPLGKISKNNKSYVTLDQKGNIAVDKTYVIKEDAADNTFAVQVKANDYKGNDVSDYVEFTVVKEVQTLGKLVLLGEDDKEILPEKDTKDNYAASALNGAKVAVLAKADATVDEESGKYADADIVDSNLYTVSVKGKGITVDENGDITVTNPTAKKLTITATTKDGGKKSVSLAIGQLVYDDIAQKNVRVAWKYSDGNVEEKTVLKTDEEGNKLVLNNGYALHSGDAFTLQIVYGEDNKLSDITKFQNYTISVSGGAKVLYDYATMDSNLAKNQILGVMLTDPANDIKVTLKNGSDRKDTKEYVLKATDAAKEELAAPQIKLDPKQTLVAGKQAEQTLKFSVTKGVVPENADFMLLGADLKSQEFFGYDAVKEITYAAKDRKITVTFKKGAIEKAGSANVYFAMTVPGEAGTQYSKLGKTVKITAVNMKKSFKLVDKYKMSAVDASKVAVAYKATGVEDVTVTNLYNENVKGQANKFTDLIGIASDDESLELKQYAVDQKISGYVEVEVTYDDGEEETIVSKVTVTLPKEGKGVNSYKAADVTLAKGKTTVAEAEKMPVVIKAGKNEADVSQAVVTSAIDGIKVAGIEDGKVYLNVKDFVDAHKKDKIKQAVELKVVLAGANDQDTDVTDNKNAITLKVNVVVPKEMLFEEERAELTPTIKFSNETPENRADDVTFTIEVKDVDSKLIKGIYYTTDGKDPALDAKGKPANNSTKKYTKEVPIPVQNVDEEATVTVKVLVVAKDQTTYKNTTATASVTFKAAETPAEPTQLTAPKITFSKPLPENRESITFTIETQAAEKDYIKGVYYTTDESEPTLDGDGNPTGTTQEYNGTEATLKGPDVDGEKLVWVKVLVVAKDKATHTDVTNSATVTFAAKTTESGDAGEGSETGN